MKKMAVLVASGTYLPRGLTFGPTNGHEDFQELVFIIFARRLYREWHRFLDDLSVSTGRKPATPPGPSNAHDVWGMLREFHCGRNILSLLADVIRRREVLGVS